MAENVIYRNAGRDEYFIGISSNNELRIAAAKIDAYLNSAKRRFPQMSVEMSFSIAQVAANVMYNTRNVSHTMNMVKIEHG